MRSGDLRILSPEMCTAAFFPLLFFCVVFFFCVCWDCCCSSSNSTVMFVTIVGSTLSSSYDHAAKQQQKNALVFGASISISMVLLNHSLQFIRQFNGTFLRLSGIKYYHFLFISTSPFTLSDFISIYKKCKKYILSLLTGSIAA